MFQLAADNPQEIQRELAALRSEVAEVRRAQQEYWVDQERAAQIEAVVRDVLADSATRTNMARMGWGSDYKDGMVIGSPDGNWTFRFGVTQQVKMVYASAYGDGPASNGNQTQWGTEVRRLNLIGTGTVVDSSLSWLVMCQYDSQPDRWSDSPNTFQPVYAYITKDFGEGVRLRVGSQNIPWDLQSSYFEGCTLVAGDYSIFNYRFGVGRECGVCLEYQGDTLRWRGGAFNRLSDKSLGWNDPTNGSVAVASRVEHRWGGSWQDYELESAWVGQETSVVAGIAGAWSNGRAQNPTSPPTPAAQGLTADVTLRTSGLGLEAQFIWMRDAAGAPELEWSLGTSFQAAWFLTDRIETFVQACWMNNADVPWISQLGVNYYIKGAQLKATFKVIVPFGGGEINGLGAVAQGLGMETASNNASVVTQMQMMF